KKEFLKEVIYCSWKTYRERGIKQETFKILNGDPFLFHCNVKFYKSPMSKPASQIVYKTEIVVIGAGQAGLSSAYHLKKLGLEPRRGFVVLDQSRKPGGAWQYRWPSLTLSTVNRIHDLPGLSFSETVNTEEEEIQASIAVPKY